MKNKKPQDERILALHRKINSEALAIVMVVLFGAILMQQYVLNAPFKQYAVEAICFLVIGIYLTIRYLMLGLNLYDEGKLMKGTPLANSIAIGIIATAINGVFNYSRYAEHYKDNIGLFFAVLVIFFISITVPVFILLKFCKFIDRKRQVKIQKKLDDEENNQL